MLASLKKTCICLLTAMSLMAASLYAQVAPHLVRIKQFSTLSGTIDFLPGAWVRVRQDKSLTYYTFRGGRFLPADPPDLIRQWQAFDWQSVDVLDQISIQNYSPDIDRFLPKDRRVKKVVEIPLPAHNNELVLICFTKKTTELYAPPGDTDIYLTGILRKADGSHSTYKPLWTLKAEADASYGDLVSQSIPNRGRFIVLYWASVGGSGGEDALDIYRLKE